MVTANINENMEGGMKEALKMVAQFDVTDMERFLIQVGRLIAAKKTPLLSKRETELMLVINKKFPDEFWVRYHELKDKMEDGRILDSEYEELLEKVQVFEARNVEWLTALIELSNLKKMTIDELMKKLEINQYHRAKTHN